MFRHALLCATLSLTALSSQAMNLNDMLSQTLKHNPDFLQAQASVEAAEAQKNASRADFMPQISATAGMGYTKSETDTGTTRLNPKSYGFQATQSLFKGGQNFHNFKSAKRNLEATELNLTATKITVLNNAAAAYLNVLTAEQVHKLNEEQSKVLNEQLKATKLRYEVGEVTQTDVRQAEARAAVAKADLVEAEAQLQTARAFYTEISGIDSSDGLTWPKVTYDFFTEEYDYWLEQTMTQNPNIKAAEMLVKRAKNLLNSARGQHLFDIEAQASYTTSQDSSRFLSGETEDTSFTLSASLPLFAGGRIFSAVKEAKANLKSAEENLEQVKREVKREFIDSYHQYRTSRARFESLKESLQANRLAYDGVSKEAEVGQRTTLDVLDARQEYLAAQVSYTQGRNAIVSSSFRLAAAIGLLDMEGINKYVEADKETTNELD